MYYSFFETTKNGVLFGFIYVSIGCFLSSEKEKNNQLKNSYLYLNLFLSIVFMIFEWYIRTCCFGYAKSCDITLGLLLLTLVLGRIFIDLKINNKKYLKLLRMLRTYSILLFLL